MINYRTGDIITEDAEALVNTVNCVGIMGRGIALQFKDAFPENFRIYRDACQRGDVQPGRMLVVETGRLTNPQYVINFPTKRHWRGKSRITDIESGLEALVGEVSRRKIRSIAIPPLGSGLGGLDWAEVRLRIERAMRTIDDVRVIVFEPMTNPEERLRIASSDVPPMTSGRAALVGLINRYNAGLMDPFVTLLEVHKLMYFMQQAGEPLKLHYAKALYGPYAENLRHVLRAIEGHLIAGYCDGGDAPSKRIELVPGAVEDAEAFLAERPTTRERFERVANLVQGFETPFGLELLSTVHWVATQPANSTPDIVSATYAWGKRKRRFTPDQISLAHDVLKEQGWLN